MGQFSVENSALPGSALSGNQHHDQQHGSLGEDTPGGALDGTENWVDPLVLPCACFGRHR